jgi:hypothetical protein
MRALLVAMLVIGARASYASHCGGGGGGGGHGGGGGGGHGHSGGGCVEVSDTVGYERCSHFGEKWSLARRHVGFWLELGFAVHHFSLPPIDEPGTVAHHGTSYAFRVVGNPRATTATSAAARLRAGGILAGPLYGALELDIGGLADGGDLHAEASGGVAPALTDPQTSYGAMRAALGLRGRVTHSIMLSAEAAAGFHALVFSMTSQLADCVQAPTVQILEGEIEARARVDYWVSPRVTFGAEFGKSLIDRDDENIAVYLGMHLRTFDGR